MYRVERVLPSALSPGHPRVFHADVDQKLSCYQTSKSYRISLNVYRYRIEVDSDIDIQH